MRTNRGDNRINTTLGELIVIVSELAIEHCADTREPNDLAHRVLVELLEGAFPKGIIVDRHRARPMLLH